MAKASNFFFSLRAAGGDEDSVGPGMGSVSDSAVTHHILKFNPMDVHAIQELDRHEWLFRKEIPAQADWEKKRKLKKQSESAVKEFDQSWKHPWLISDSNDKNFEKAFLARRETDKKSKLDCFVSVTLTEVVAKCKGDPDLTNRLRPHNETLIKLYKACEQAACGPGTDVFAKDVTTKKRVLDGNDTYKCTSMLVRIPASSLKLLEEKKAEEEELTTKFVKEFKDELKRGVVDFNGKIIQFKVDEAGRKQHSFFWLESHGQDKKGETVLLLRPVHGDWWSVRKDATRRGVEAPLAEGDEGRRAIKKEKEEPAGPKKDIYKRLMAKTEEERSKTLEQGAGGHHQQGSVSSSVALARKSKRGDQTGEDGMKQQWREESHDVDDEMDAQQCGDIDDDDYDQRMAAAGDDLALNPDDLQKALYEDVAEEVVKEMSDDDDDEERENKKEKRELLGLDDDGEEMDRILAGKPPKKKDDKSRDRERSSSPEEASKAEEDKEKAAASSSVKVKTEAQKVGSIKVKLPSSSLGKRPDAAQASAQPAKKAKTAPAKLPTADEMRAAIAADPHMCVKKLIEDFSIKTMGKEQQEKFLTTMKGMCLKTKKLVPDGKYKDQAIIQLKKPAGA